LTAKIGTRDTHIDGEMIDEAANFAANSALARSPAAQRRYHAAAINI
jgi:hypothetical protein